MKRLYIILLLIIIVLSGCSKLLVNEPDSNLNMEDFNSAWQIAEKYYPFFKFKNIDWHSLYIKYEPIAEAAKGDEIYNVLYQMFRELKDGHIEILTEGGFPIMTYDWPRDIDKKTFSSNVVSSYFNSPLQLAGENNYDYRITPGNIGYVYISTFSNGDGNWYKDFDKITKYFQNTKGIIVDVRNNEGGDNFTWNFIVSRFVVTPITYSFYLANGVPFITSTIKPEGEYQYRKPVVVLANGASFSATELFVELMKQIPNVTVIGDTTGGGGGSTGTYNLPSGKRIQIPDKYFRKFNGDMIEWNGVSPNIFVKQTSEDIANGNDKQLEYAINFLNK